MIRVLFALLLALGLIGVSQAVQAQEKKFQVGDDEKVIDIKVVKIKLVKKFEVVGNVVGIYASESLKPEIDGNDFVFPGEDGDTQFVEFYAKEPVEFSLSRIDGKEFLDAILVFDGRESLELMLIHTVSAQKKQDCIRINPGFQIEVKTGNKVLFTVCRKEGKNKR